MPEADHSSPDRLARIGVVVLTLAVFAGVVAFVTQKVRRDLHEQILQREATMLREVAAMELREEVRTSGGTRLPGAALAAVLRASKLGSVIALRLFDEQRHFVIAEPGWWEELPADRDWQQLSAGNVVARLHTRHEVAALGDLLPAPVAGREGVPLVEAWVPLGENAAAPFAGAAQFWLQGDAIEAQFRALDVRLWWQAALAWLAGSLVIAAALAWAFRRLAAANRELQLRSENLQRANRELVLAAKSSALGSVTAHLIHALKNPIAGLEVFVASQAENAPRDESGQELAAATELTRRLRGMVNDVVSVLRDEQSGSAFELSGDELVEIALAKARPLAAARNVQLHTDSNSDVPLPARRANLAALVLYNLLQNAIEATPAGRAVRVTASAQGAGAEFTIADEGGGLPVHVRERLFQPCTSTKLGGSGLGLALSQQLARHAAGRIELARSDASGTTFRLVLDPDS